MCINRCGVVCPIVATAHLIESGKYHLKKTHRSVIYLQVRVHVSHLRDSRVLQAGRSSSGVHHAHNPGNGRGRLNASVALRAVDRAAGPLLDCYANCFLNWII